MKTRDIVEIEKILSIHANLPYSYDGDYQNLEYEHSFTYSLIGNLLNYVDKGSGFPDIKRCCVDILEAFYELTIVINDKKNEVGCDICDICGRTDPFFAEQELPCSIEPTKSKVENLVVTTACRVKGVISEQQLSKIYCTVSCLQNSLFTVYLRLLQQRNIESEKTEQIQSIIWFINQTWNYFLDGEPSKFFWTDLQYGLDEMINDKGLTYLSKGCEYPISRYGFLSRPRELNLDKEPQ